MCPLPNYVSSVAYLIADPARASMLIALVDGRALPAGELAYAAGVTAQTASAHLAKLLEGGLLTVEKEGRHRYYRLSGPQVAHALEHLAALKPEPVRRKPLSRDAQTLRLARRCYDHLAGKLGVAVTSGLQARGFIVQEGDEQFSVPSSGMEWFAAMGIDMEDSGRGTRGFARPCLDWTERRHHLGGPLGVRLLSAFCALDWLQRSDASRAILVTPRGWEGLKKHFGIDERDCLDGTE